MPITCSDLQFTGCYILAEQEVALALSLANPMRFSGPLSLKVSEEVNC
jgi:hypothetical protein